MIECWVALGDGRELNLPTPVQWKFCYGTGQPCDSFYLRTLWESGRERELSAAARFFAQWNGERVFTGVVDEFAAVCGRDGMYLELSGRGMAALLLDNESMPAVYQRATVADIAENHVEPYGIQVEGGGGLPTVSGFSVKSGVSEWSVVEDYACGYGGIVPRFDRMGRLILDGHEDRLGAVLDDDSPVAEWDYRETRYGVLSGVAVRRRSDWGTQWVEDPAFLAEGGCARRVITVPDTTGTAAMRWSADYQLRASRRERVRLTITVAEPFAAWPGELVEVKLSGFGGNGCYRVAQSEAAFGMDGLTTTLVLGEPDSMI